MVRYHDDKEFILAPYLADGHWTLFIIAVKVRQVYILDSLFKKGKKNPSRYLLTSVIQSALLSIKPTFDMVNCIQQAETWECGYILLQSMFDFVNVYQKQFPRMWNDTKVATDEDIEKTLKELMPILFDGLSIP
ncbi:putative Ulp1 protease family catalytic domain, papain-like cysteine peptidase superfamily [Helianthus debilis subsp. tardiflorus]